MSVSERVNRVRAGDRRAIAALMRDLDDDRPGATDELRALRATGAGAGIDADVGAHAGAFVVGITGAPGVGKSTLVDTLVAAWRARGERVGVVAVDPTSPLGGGAILGDRVRMQRHAVDDGVFIRSLASRGAQGGLSRSAGDIIDVLAAGGFSSVLVETVGVGQAEVEIAAAADVTVVVTVPGLGDDIQTLKSGVLEIADVLIVNKSDRPGADQAVRDLQAMLELRRASAVAIARSARGGLEASTDVPVVRVVATSGEGIAALMAAIDVVRAGRAGPESEGRIEQRRRRAEARILAIVMARMAAVAREVLRPGGAAAGLANDVAERRLDLHAAVDALMARLRERY